jgi:hypothetical protein
MTPYQLQKKIENRFDRIEILFNDIIQLKDEKNLLCEYYEKEDKIRLDTHGNTTYKGRKQMTVLGFTTYHEDFVDEDTGEVVNIGRSLLCRINGKPCNDNGKLYENMDYKELKKFI